MYHIIYCDTLNYFGLLKYGRFVLILIPYRFL